MSGHGVWHQMLLRFKFLTNWHYPVTNLRYFSNDQLQKYDLKEKNSAFKNVDTPAANCPPLI